LFAINSPLVNETYFVIKTGMVIFGIMIISNVFSSVLIGLQRMDIGGKITIFGSFINFLGTIFFLEKGYGLSGLIINTLIVNILTGLITFIVLMKKLPDLKLGVQYSQKEMFEKLFKFGIKLQLAKLAFLVSFHLDKLLLAKFANVSYVGMYDLASKVCFTIRRFSLLTVSAITPAASELDALTNKEMVYKFYFKGTKYLMLLCLPFFSFCIIYAPLILKVWLGKEYSYSIDIMRILGIGYCMNALTGMATTVAAGIAKPEFEMKYSLISVPLNTILSVLLILKIGPIGAGIATSISFVICSFYLINLFHNYFEKSILDFLKLIYKPAIACILAGFSYFLFMQFNVSNRVNNFLLLFIAGIVFFIIYIIFVFITKFINKKEFKM
jgi:O-antigen/teichoic acid export membrane protein